MANSININGIEYAIEGDELATEATLRSLVDAVNRLGRAQSQNNQRNQSTPAAGGAAQGGSSDALNRVQDAAEDAAGGLDQLNNNVIRMGASNNNYIRLIGKNVQGFGSLSNIVGKLGGVITVVVTAFFAFKGVIDDMTETVADMNAAGMRFSGGFYELSRQAGDAGLSVTEFGRLLRENQSAIARFGNGTITDGSKKMVAFARELTFGKTNLAGLGIGVGEAAEYIAEYAELQQYLNGVNIAQARAGETQEQVAKRVAAETESYVQNLDDLARTTGKTRQEMAKLMNEMSKDADLTSTLAMLNLPAKSKDNIIKFATLLKGLPGGETLMSGLKDMLQFGTMTGETAQAFATVGPQLQGTFANIAENLKSGAITEEQARDQMMDAMGSNAEQIMQTLGSIPESARTQAQKDLIMAAQQAKANKQAREGEIEALVKEGKTRQQAVDTIKKRRDDEARLSKQMENTQKRFGQMFDTLLLRIFGNKIVMSLLENVMNMLEQAGNFIYGILDKVTGGNGFTKGLDKLVEASAKILKGIFKVLNVIVDVLAPPIGYLVDILGNVVSVVSDVIGFIVDLLTLNWGALGEDLGSMGESLFNTFESMMKPITALIDWISGINIIDGIKSMFTGIMDWVSSFDLLSPVKAFFSGIGDFFSNLDIGGMISGAIGFVVDGLIGTITAPFKLIGSFFSDGTEGVVDTVNSVVDTIMSPLTMIQSLFSNGLEPIKTAINSAIDFLSAPIDAIASIFGSSVEEIKSFVSTAIDSLKVPFELIGEVIGGAIDMVKALIDRTITVILAPFDAIRGLFTSGISGLIKSLENTIAAIFAPFNLIIKWFTGFDVGKIMGDLWKAIKSKFNPLNWFGGGDKKKEEAKPAAAASGKASGKVAAPTASTSTTTTTTGPELLIADKPVKQGQPLTKEQMQAVVMAKDTGVANKYPAFVLDQFEKQGGREAAFGKPAAAKAAPVAPGAPKAEGAPNAAEKLAPKAAATPAAPVNTDVLLKNLIAKMDQLIMVTTDFKKEYVDENSSIIPSPFAALSPLTKLLG